MKHDPWIRLSHFVLLGIVSGFPAVQAAGPLLGNNDFSVASPSDKARANKWMDGARCQKGLGNYSRALLRSSSGARNYVMKLATNGNKNAAASGCQIVKLNQKEFRPVFVGGWIKGSNIEVWARNNAKTKRAGAPGGDYGVYMTAIFTVFGKDKPVECSSFVSNGSFDWRWVGINSYSDCYITNPIISAKVITRLARARGTAYFDNLSVEDKISAFNNTPPAPQVTFFFDDDDRSTYTKAFPILSQQGYRASMAVYTNNLLPSSTPGAAGLSYDDLYALVKNAGWEVVSHSMNHRELTEFSEADAIKELADSQTLLRNGLQAAAARQNDTGFDPTTQAQHFAWPYGVFNANLIGQAQRYYQSARTTWDGTNDAMGTYQWTTLSRTFKSTRLETVAKWLSDACQNNQWLIMTSHMVDGDPAEPYNITSDYLNSVVNLVKFGSAFANGKTIKVNCPDGFFSTGFNVVTYGEGMKIFGATPTPKPL